MPYCAPHGLARDTVRRLAAAVGVDAIMLAKRGRNFNSLYELSGECRSWCSGPPPRLLPSTTSSCTMWCMRRTAG